MPSFAYPAPSKYLVPFLPNANPDAYYMRLALQTKYNIADFNPMTWMLLRNDVYCRHRATRAAKKATRDDMHRWCIETMCDIPRAVFLTTIPLAGYPNTFYSANATADIWYYASRHIEFKNVANAVAFRLKFGALVESKDEEDENRLFHSLFKDYKPRTIIYL